MRHGPCGRRADTGAAAVEFALVALPLFTLLFGIIQYGFVFYQVQGASATVKDAARWASEGITDCAGWDDATLNRAAVNGVGANLSPQAAADFDVVDGRDVVTVTLTFVPLHLVPLVPVPASITRSAQFDVEFRPADGIAAEGAGVVECP